VVKKKKKVPLRKIIRRLEKKADKAVSLYIRKRDSKVADNKCVICKVNPIQCAFHIVRRGRKILRWDPRNIVATCHRCNYIEYRNPDISRAFFIREYGVELYLKLVDDSQNDFESTIENLEEIIKKFEKELKEL
jgi:hypothetical protein